MNIESRPSFTDGRHVVAEDLLDERGLLESGRERHLYQAHPIGDDEMMLLRGDAIHCPRDGSVIRLADGHGDGAVSMSVPGAIDALVVKRGGHRIRGGLSVRNGLIADGVHLRPLKAAPKMAVPWNIRAVETKDKQGIVVSRELCIELGLEAGGLPTASQVVIGSASKGDFTPHFRVDAIGNVTTTTDLNVRGAVTQGPVRADPTDPRFVRALSDVVARRVIGAAKASPTTVDFTATPSQGSSNASTVISLSITPLGVLTHWVIAVEIRRSGTSAFRIANIGANTSTKTDRELVMPWTPPLTSGADALIDFGIAGFTAAGLLVSKFLTIAAPFTP
jgi:hypothetical protein